jgi:short-chain Z-isoprenyl diphosphate synthase
VVETIDHLESQTAANDGMTLNIAMAYDGRQEIVDAARAHLSQVAESGGSFEEALDRFSVDAISRNLYTAGIPDPDFIIRTSGEQRLSGFCLWQSAYSEYYFTDVLWPDFRRIDFLRCIRSYQGRQRRFGR